MLALLSLMRRENIRKESVYDQPDQSNQTKNVESAKWYFRKEIYELYLLLSFDGQIDEHLRDKLSGRELECGQTEQELHQDTL